MTNRNTAVAQQKTVKKAMAFITECDMGSIKIFNSSMSLFYENGVVGDGTNIVNIYKRTSVDVPGNFVGHFTVKSNDTYLSSYDCIDKPLYKFGKGWWFVYRESEKPIFHIVRTENDID
ncbi:MAG TPA: hypothetical protein PLA06_07315 [Syntrophorhabdaceae bacterium]|jgi:hypothetical protein|nr:hypothetical protein [Pseudomonadota bacterium]HQP51970.1 hypothetical protein [Syntrophorhabdaceae bacterium]